MPRHNPAPVARLVLAVLALGVVALAALPAPPAQYTGPAIAYNVLTGRLATGRAGGNPLTQAGSPAPADNPLTGRSATPVPAPNPLTGAPQAAYNPLTGRYGQRGEQRSPPGSYQRRIPVTGKAGPGLEAADEAMLAVLEKHGIPGGALAIVKDGKLVLARGYGWGNLATSAPVIPDATFGVASLSKTLTAVAVLKLVEEGKLKLDDRVIGLLSHLKPPPGARVDPRLGTVTVRQLLNHSGGWDRKKSGEPWAYSWQVSRRLRVPLPIGTDQLTRFMLGVRLDFTPGTELQYSNYGYILLGQVIEKVS